MSNFRKWYGMRKGMSERGAWKHKVPAQEEGEPPTKQPKISGLEPDSAGGDTDPEEGTSKQAQEDLGEYIRSKSLHTEWLGLSLDQVDALCWYGWLPRFQEGQRWRLINHLTRRKKCSRMPVVFWEYDGELTSPIISMAGCCTHSVVNHVILSGCRQLIGL